MRAKGCLYIPHQPIYNNALLFCGQNTYASVVRIIHAENTKKGIDFSTKCLFVEESKKLRKVVSEESAE